jgi:hypothetical protein
MLFTENAISEILDVHLKLKINGQFINTADLIQILDDGLVLRRRPVML